MFPSTQCLLNTFIVTKTILILKLIYIDFFLFFCVEPSVFNHLFLSNRDTSVLAKQLVVCLLLLDELSYSLLLVACLYPFCALLVAGLSIAKVLGNQAVRPKFLSSPSRLVSDAEASLVYVVNFRTAGAT